MTYKYKLSRAVDTYLDTGQFGVMCAIFVPLFVLVVLCLLPFFLFGQTIEWLAGWWVRVVEKEQ